MRRSRTRTKPFFHTATVRFTATEELNHSEIEERIRNAFRYRSHRVLRDTIVVEEVTVEEGNPQDLMP